MIQMNDFELEQIQSEILYDLYELNLRVVAPSRCLIVVPPQKEQ